MFIEQPKIEVIEKHEPNLEEFGKLFFLSFKYSQGDTLLQKHIFGYLKSIHPEWEISRSFLDRLHTLMEPKFNAYMKNAIGRVHAHHNREGEEVQNDYDAVGREYNELRNNWNSFGTDREQWIRFLSNYIIKKDHAWLTAPSGRNKTPAERYHPDRDPYLSQLIWYGFMGNPTGPAEYGSMFRDVTDYIKGGNLNHDDQAKLLTIFKIWNEHHPDQQLDLNKELSLPTQSQ